MPGETIDAIAKEINSHYRTLKELLLKNELNENKGLFIVYWNYEKRIFPGTTKEEFAAIYSQAVIFCLLSAVLFHSKKVKEENLNNILDKILMGLDGLDSSGSYILASIAAFKIPDRLHTFIYECKDKIAALQTGDLTGDEILALVYQRFLKRYEPGIHKKIRYYLTPRPAVSFMVYTIHRLLKEKLNIDDGLANMDIQVMDPTFGTGNFLGESLRVAIEKKIEKYGTGIMGLFIESYLSRNISGCEIMLPLYVMGFIYLAKITEDFCAGFQENIWRSISNLFLCDTLDYPEKTSIMRKNATKVILCNPPYSRHSLNKGKQITRLLRDYLQVNDRRIEEKNLKGLVDDYVKFFRLAQWEIDRNGMGAMGFITNNSYLENPTFRGMRYSLLKSFDEIYILDLHGRARKGKSGKNAGDENDENIFDVSQGIAIGFFIKRKKPGMIRESPGNLECKVYYASMKGSKADKLKKLEELKESDFQAVQWERVFPVEDFYLFTPGKPVDIYRNFLKVTDIFPLHSVGIVTARDKVAIKESENEVFETISFFSSSDEKETRKNFNLGADTRDWSIKEARKDIDDSFIDRKKIVPILYRPFDIRYTYYTGRSRGFLCMPRPGVMRHMLQENPGLVTVRQVPGGDFSHCFAADTIVESRVITSQKGIAYIFPLYKYVFPTRKGKKKQGYFNINDVFPGKKDMSRESNINPVVFERLQGIFGKEKLPSARQIFYYIYAILNSGVYRERYRDHLKIDFPCIPFSVKPGLFMKLSGLGEALVDFHLMKSKELDYIFSKFEVIGDNLVKKPRYKPITGRDGRVYINEIQYFSHISKELWEFEICGYQVLKKWLKDRKNRVLSTGDILHYIKICRAVQLTIDYRRQIDRLYSELEKDL
jgi:predicted helicase